MLAEHSHSVLIVMVWKLDELLITSLGHVINIVVVGIATDSPSEVHVLLHYCHAVSMNSTEVGILEDSNEVSL